jgi:release factor glutamine methyltransferase
VICGHPSHHAVIAAVKTLERPKLTTTYSAPRGALAAEIVYQPQHDSWLLIDVMRRTGLVARRRVLDLCTGSGVVAIAAARLRAANVTAFDICPSAVECSRGNATGARVEVDIREGSWMKAFDCAPFEVVVSNPPYVPAPPADDIPQLASTAGPSWAWNAGHDGRLILDPLCESASSLLCDGGSALLVQSALADPQRSLDILRSTGMGADIVASQWIPFGLVLSARTRWLEDSGHIPRGCRQEQLVVIRADKP